MKLNREQKRIIAEMLSNIAVAWFAVGVISPFFVKPTKVSDFLWSFAFSLISFLFFSLVAIYSLKR